MQMASRTNAAWGVAGNIGLRPSKKYPRLGRGIFIFVCADLLNLMTLPERAFFFTQMYRWGIKKGKQMYIAWTQSFIAFAFSRRGHLRGKCCKLPLCNLANAPGVRIRKSKKTQQKVRKRISAIFFKEMVPIQVKKLHKKIFVPEIPWDIVVKNTF